MRSLLVFAGLAIWSPGALAQAPAPAHFDVSNSDFVWAVTGDLSGAIENTGDSLRLTVSKCVFSRTTKLQGPVTVAAIRAGIARGSSASWRIERHSAPQPVAFSLRPGETRKLEPFTLTIPLAGFELQAGDTFLFDIDTTNLLNGKETHGTVYVRSTLHLPGAPASTAATPPGAASAPAQSAPTTRFEQALAAESRAGQVVREGSGLTPQQATALENDLTQKPGDLNTRAKLLGFYFSPASQSLGLDARIKGRRTHLLWLIHNHPESLFLTTAESTIDSAGHALADAEGYQQARKAWLEQTDTSSCPAVVLGNAARFFTLPDKALAAKLYGRARKTEPDNELWVTLQGNTMAFAIVGIEGLNQNGLPSGANASDAGSAYALAARRELETSQDLPLIRAAANALMARGAIAQALARQSGQTPQVDALQLSETLLKRALDLQPNQPEINQNLARIYELRAMSVTDPAEKQRLARARFEQLSQAAEATPPNTMLLIALATAALDSGNLPSAETAGKQLLELLPKVQADPQQRGMADYVVHHTYLILGRVALRQGNLDTAKADLLESGRVSGGGTLSSFGPNMTLARELLEKGESATVLQYFELCRKFWAFSNRMDPWIEAIHKGQVPDFGANLNY